MLLGFDYMYLYTSTCWITRAVHGRFGVWGDGGLRITVALYCVAVVAMQTWICI